MSSETAPKRVVVTGATGIVGRFVMANLIAHGVQVRALCRQISNREGIAGQVEWMVADTSTDLTVNDVWPILLDGADAVVHCAFHHQPGRYRGGEGDNPLAFWDNNFRPTLQLLQECNRQQTKSCVLLSSRAVFGAAGSGNLVGDGSPTNPDTHYGALKAAEEALASAFAAQGSTRIHCLRSTGVFGTTFPLTRNKWWPLVTECLDAQEQQKEEQKKEQKDQQVEPDITDQVSSEVSGIDLADAVWRLLCAHDESQVVFNCSDLLISHTELVHRVTGATASSAGFASMSPTDPTVRRRVKGPVMSCEGLHRLGWRPTGEQHLITTLEALVAAYYSDRTT